jgi:hypothetical protein
MFVAVCDGLVLAGDEGVALLPFDLVEGIASGDREVALDADPRVLRYDGVHSAGDVVSLRRSHGCLQASPVC